MPLTFFVILKGGVSPTSRFFSSRSPSPSFRSSSRISRTISSACAPRFLCKNETHPVISDQACDDSLFLQQAAVFLRSAVNHFQHQKIGLSPLLRPDVVQTGNPLRYKACMPVVLLQDGSPDAAARSVRARLSEAGAAIPPETPMFPP